jgi:thioesterase domain-containing protein
VGRRSSHEDAAPAAPAAPGIPALPAEISPLVEVRAIAEGSRPPLFFIHPANGHSSSYLALGRHLVPDLPLYTLQSPGLTGGRLYAGMEGIANAYLEAMRTIQPHGPYRLGGWCVGGTFAYEMARRLRAQGEEVELLVLVDSHAPEPEHLAPHDEVVLLASLAQEIGAAAGKRLDLPLDELRRIPPEERLGWVVETARKLEILPESFSAEQARWHWEVFRSNVRAVESYRPERQPLRAILFRATRQIHEAEGKPSLGWARWITGRLDVVSVEGDHYDVVREPAVETVARVISERLAPAPAAAAH